MSKKAKSARNVAESMKSVKRAAARQRQACAKRAAEVAARVPREGYEPCIVSFVDVLGFRDLLATRHAHDIRDLLLQLREFTAPSEVTTPRRTKDARLVSRVFADSVSDAVVRVRVFDTQYGDGAFFHEILDLLHAQVQCVGNGIVIRAGVTIGDAHVGVDGKGPVFGPAMVRAYEIETTEAVHPRIVIDEAAWQCFLSDRRLRKEGHDLEEEVRYVTGMLRVDEDGQRFIDYLRASESEIDDTGDYFGFLEQHTRLVSENLAAHSGSVRAKFEWLACYHNSVIEEILVEFGDGRRSAEAFEVEWLCDPVPLLRSMIVDE